VSKDVELGDYERIDAVEHFGVTQHSEIEPAAAAAGVPVDPLRIPCRARGLRRAFEVGHFGGKGPTADARGVTALETPRTCLILVGGRHLTPVVGAAGDWPLEEVT